MAHAVVTERVPPALEIQARLAEAKNYNDWIYSQFEPWIGHRILDVGCGIGNVTQLYADRDLVIGLDVIPEELDVIKSRLNGSNFEGHLMDVGSASLAAFRGREIDTVMCLNVLEHVRDDEAALRNIRDLLIPRGHLCLLVPVYGWLFGPMDEIDRHHRRYSRRDLNLKLRDAGFEIVHQRYFNFAGICAWFLTNHVLRQSLARPAHYALYDRLVPFLRAVESVITPPAGLSLVTVCEK
jgi:SAM-dependent methyltransferase